MEYITIWDFILLPLYIIIIYFIAYKIKSRNIEKRPEYKYYISGLFVKIFGGICVCLIYIYYYKGGDTISYYESALAVSNMLYKSSDVFFSILSGDLSKENFSFFDASTSWPPSYIYKDPSTFAVGRFSVPFMFFSFKSYFIVSILIAWASFSGIWRLYLLFCENYPDIKKELAIAILFMPSVFFWGSGLLKDSYTLSAAAWLVFSIYRIILKKEGLIKYSISSIISIYILLSIKPYIFFAICLGILIWLFFDRFSKIKSTFFKVLILPAMAIIVILVGSIFVSKVGNIVGGEYESVDKLVEKASITQEDLSRESYGSNSFNIGTFDASIGSLASKAPIAITAGLFRPFIWECNNPVMVLSGLENFAMLLMTIFVIFKVGPRLMFQIMLDNSLVMFSIIFAVFFAFSVGLTTANFGALVRYKIPLIPFFMSGLFIIIDEYKKDLKRKLEL